MFVPTSDPFVPTSAGVVPTSGSLVPTFDNGFIQLQGSSAEKGHYEGHSSFSTQTNLEANRERQTKMGLQALLVTILVFAG